jgi:hypothetical protein
LPGAAAPFPGFEITPLTIQGGVFSQKENTPPEVCLGMRTVGYFMANKATLTAIRAKASLYRCSGEYTLGTRVLIAQSVS